MMAIKPLFWMALLVSVATGQTIGADYVTEAPATVYEAEATSPQNMDFDQENNMFIAHSGWLNDKLIHYYKFRMYTPSTYAGIIVPGSSFSDVPLQKMMVVTTTGDLTGVVGQPIIEYHTADGLAYSDFMEIVYVQAPAGYVADTYKSSGDVMVSGAAMTPSGIVCNIPVVPTGSTLQDPALKGINAAPIAPVPVWYKGVEVWTYVFEVTDQAAADFFSATRTVDSEDFAYAIPVTTFATSDLVIAIPLWHLNQFTSGVVEGENGGGPSPAGMRNIINLDRGDAGYSPLWQIDWVTELPVNYLADQVSNNQNLDSEDGFTFVRTPMFVNCPDIGLVGTEINAAMTETFMPKLDLSMDTNMIMGSHMSLIMQGGVNVTFVTMGMEVGRTTTNMMGAYELELMSSMVPKSTTEIMVMAKGVQIRTIPIMAAAGDSDYITEAPATVYEAQVMSPQNMDFDKENNMFIAHSGWLNDKLIHYYKFRMFTPSTYSGLIAPGSSSGDVPLQKMMVVTTTGDLNGVVGKPIIEYHTADGLVYSDFMEIVYVEAPMGYIADMYKSVGDVMESGATMTPSGIVCNIPVVPTDSKLQDPALKGTNAAPIDPVPVWYKGVEVWTYVFEVTDQAAADFFAFTRPVDPSDFAYAIPVTTFASSSFVSAIPLWHVNQFTNGVTEGSNGGGPSPAGMRNIINLDRGDGGYSPLWSINWVTELPLNYLADQVSNNNDLNAEGFTFVATPMFVNCPDIGLVGTETNTMMTDSFMTQVDLAKESNIILGSHMSMIMQGWVEVSFQTMDGTEIAATQTNMMGAYELELMSSAVPEGTTELKIMAKGAKIRSIAIQSAAPKCNICGDGNLLSNPDAIVSTEILESVSTTGSAVSNEISCKQFEAAQTDCARFPMQSVGVTCGCTLSNGVPLFPADDGSGSYSISTLSGWMMAAVMALMAALF